MKNLKKKVVNKTDQIISRFRNNGINAFWFNAVVNSGDLVTPFLLRKYGFTPVLTAPDQATIIACGSLMQRVSKEYSKYILGTGFLTDGPPLDISKANILALRGKYTRDRIGARKDIPLGDPGLLMANYLVGREKKKYLVGITPHYTEKNDEWLKSFISENKEQVTLIDIQQKPLNVLRKMDQCEFIFSSSLHGIVFADSLNIPNVWISLSKSSESRIYKFNDYYSAYEYEHQLPFALAPEVSLKQVISKAMVPDIKLVKELSQKLDEAFAFLANAELTGKGH